MHLRATWVFSEVFIWYKKNLITPFLTSHLNSCRTIISRYISINNFISDEIKGMKISRETVEEKMRRICSELVKE